MLRPKAADFASSFSICALNKPIDAASTLNSAMGDKPGIFAGGKFFISLQLPNYSLLKRLVRDRSGEVVMREADANWLIFDPDKPHKAPNGAISYKIILDSIDEGRFQDPKNYTIQGITSRPAGSTRPAKSTRNPFTAADDRMIYQRVQEYYSDKTDAGKMEMWKKMQRDFPHHTWQAYMARYDKILKFHPPAGMRETQPLQDRTGHKRKYGEDEQQNESNTKKKRVSVEPEPEERQVDLRDIPEDGGESVNGEHRHQSIDSEEQLQFFETAHERLPSDSPAAANVGTQFQDTFTDEHAFCIPEPQGGFIETQQQESQVSSQFIQELHDHVQPGLSPDPLLAHDADGEEEQDDSSVVKVEEEEEEEPRPFPELVKMYQDEGLTEEQVRTAERHNLQLLLTLLDSHGCSSYMWTSSTHGNGAAAT